MVEGLEQQFQGKSFFVRAFVTTVVLEVTLEECSVFVDFIKNRGIFTLSGGHQAEEFLAKPVFPIVGGTQVTRRCDGWHEWLIITIGVVGFGFVIGGDDYR